MKGRPQAKVPWFDLAQAMEGCSYAEIELLVNEAARAALSDRRPITSNDLINALQSNPPQPKARREEFD